jgi:hypothetical protein
MGSPEMAGPFFVGVDSMSSSVASELSRRLAQDAEAVCRYYLSNGRRHGRYWIVGDARNTPGRSLFVRLTGPESGKGAAGHWTDAASGAYGDLLDVIRESVGLKDFSDVLDEARRFLSLPRADPRSNQRLDRKQRPTGSPDSARRLFALSRPIAGTLAERYLHHPGIATPRNLESLRFHPCCFYRSGDGSSRETWPAMIAAVTDRDGQITGVHRTWLDRSGGGKAPIASPRRAMGELLGNGVRFGAPLDVIYWQKPSGGMPQAWVFRECESAAYGLLLAMQTIVELTGGIGVDRAIDAVGVDAEHAHHGPSASVANKAGAAVKAAAAAIAPCHGHSWADAEVGQRTGASFVSQHQGDGERKRRERVSARSDKIRQKWR